MDPNTTRYLHAKFLVHCAPQDAIDCIIYHWDDARVEQKVMSLCEGDSQKYLTVLESTRQDVAKLAAIFNPALNPGTPEPAFASPGAFAQKNQLRPPSSIQSPVPSLSRLTDTSTPSLSRSRVAEYSSGWVFGNGPGSNPETCSIGKSNSPYRFVRADFLARFGPPHMTIACEMLNTYVEGIGLVSSSEYVCLTWQRRGRNRTHAEKFWIVENQEICDIMTANEPSPISPAQNPKPIEPSAPHTPFQSGPAFRSPSYHGSFNQATHPPFSPQTSQASLTGTAHTYHTRVAPHPFGEPLQPDYVIPQNGSATAPWSFGPPESGKEVAQHINIVLRLEGSTRPAELKTNDVEGIEFLQQLNRLYTGVYKRSRVLDRSAVELQFTPMAQGRPSGARFFCPLGVAHFQRYWRGVLNFVREHHACDEFEVEIEHYNPTG